MFRWNVHVGVRLCGRSLGVSKKWSEAADSLFIGCNSSGFIFSSKNKQSIDERRRGSDTERRSDAINHTITDQSHDQYCSVLPGADEVFVSASLQTNRPAPLSYKKQL